MDQFRVVSRSDNSPACAVNLRFKDLNLQLPVTAVQVLNKQSLHISPLANCLILIYMCTFKYGLISSLLLHPICHVLQLAYQPLGGNLPNPKETFYISIQTGIFSPFSFNNFLFIQIRGAMGETKPRALIGPDVNINIFRRLYFFSKRR